ncbi:MAG: hypothetical protein WC683_18520 [bacterium]
MRLAREQIERVQTYKATWVHPDGVAWKTLGTLLIPGTDESVSVHVKARMKLAGSTTGMVTHRVLPLTIDDAGGPIVFVIVGVPLMTQGPGETIMYQTDLAGADLQFVCSVVGANVQVLVQLRWPALVGGQSLEVGAELWWE